MKFYSVIFFLLLGSLVYGQEARNEVNKQTKKFERIIKILDLNEEEIERFEPLLVSYTEELKKIKASYRGDLDKDQKMIDLEEAELSEFVKSRLMLKKDLLQKRLDYHDRFVKAISARKTAKLYVIEDRLANRSGQNNKKDRAKRRR